MFVDIAFYAPGTAAISLDFCALINNLISDLILVNHFWLQNENSRAT